MTIFSGIVGIAIGLCVSVVIFVLHPFGSEDKKLQITLPIERYSPLMSSVPGLPVKIDCTGSVQLSVTAGSLLIYDNGHSGKVADLGKTAALEGGGTVFWSPLDGKDTSSGTKSYSRGEQVARLSIKTAKHVVIVDILADEPLYYTAKIVDFKQN